MKQLASKVGEYNKFDVVPQYKGGYNPNYTSSMESTDSGYRIFHFDSYDSQLYKYGLLLVKDIINGTKQEYASDRVKKAEHIKEVETYVRKDYAVGTDNYANTFTEVTGIPYDSTVIVNGSPSYSASLNYKDGQIAKSKQQTLYYDSHIKLDNTWSLPQDYYYVTYSIDGKQYTETEEVKWYLDRTKENWIYDEKEEMYVQDPSVYVNPDNYFLCYTTEDGTESKVYYKDVTFHYEPFTVDTAPVNQAIEKKVRADVERDSGWGKESYASSTYAPIETTEFYKLSQAEQQYYMAFAFGQATTWCGYSKKGSSNGDGLPGIKAMLKHDWWGVCSNYADMEITMYKLFGISSNDYCYIECRECNHAWSAVRVKNAHGKRAWIKNDYGMGDIATTDQPRHYHDGKKHTTVINNFVFPE